MCFADRLLFVGNDKKTDNDMRKRFKLVVSLRENCPYSEFFCSVFSRIQCKWGKTRTTRKTPNIGNFYALFSTHCRLKIENKNKSLSHPC